MAAVQTVTGFIGGTVEGNNRRKEAEKANDALEARKAWMLQEKRMSKRIYELQTFSKYYDEQSAGAARIASAASLGQSTSSISAINSLSRSLLKRNLKVEDTRFKHELATIDHDISNLERQKRDPSGERQAAIYEGILKGGASGLGTVAQGYAYSGK